MEKADEWLWLAAVQIMTVVAAVLAFSRYMRPSQAALIQTRLSLTLDLKPPPFKRLLAVVNPISGRRTAEQDWSDVARALRSHGISIDTIVTQRSGHTLELFRSISNFHTEYDLLVAVGGDGFLHEVLNALVALKSSPPEAFPAGISVVPSGTGNGVATSLGISTVPDAAHALLAGSMGPLDLLRVEVAGSQSRLAALSVAWGAIADHDAYAENGLRALPGKSLLVPLWIIACHKTYRGRLSFVPAARQAPLARSSLLQPLENVASPLKIKMNPIHPSTRPLESSSWRLASTRIT